MGTFAEDCAEGRSSFTRDAQDAYALARWKTPLQAIESGAFNAEVRAG